jgi:hypothetical protein
MTKLTRNGSEPLVDYMSTTDIYVDGIGRIDNNGATSYVHFYQRQLEVGAIKPKTQHAVVLRLIVPTAELAKMAATMSKPETVAEALSETDAEDRQLAIH